MSDRELLDINTKILIWCIVFLTISIVFKIKGCEGRWWNVC